MCGASGLSDMDLDPESKTKKAPAALFRRQKADHSLRHSAAKRNKARRISSLHLLSSFVRRLFFFFVAAGKLSVIDSDIK